MKKKEISRMLTVGLTTSMVLNPFSESILNVSAQQVKNNYESSYSNVLSDLVSKDEIYLSNIEYESGSSAGWGEIRKDSNVDGDGLIRLNVDGEVKEFEKGMSAHATSTLIYDVSDYKNTYTRFVSYLGVDARRGNNGNGVIFTISTSEDGKNWTEVKKTGVLKGNNEACYVDIELNGANFIKLYADENNGNGSDHSVYGDAKLVKADYTLSGTPIEGLQTVAQYDDILKNESINNNITTNKMIILRRALVQRVGYESLQRIAGQDVKYNEGINYLMSNEKALNYFIMGGPVNMHGSYQRSLKSFCEIYDKYKDIMDDTDDDNFNLRLAISIALSYSRTETVGSWMKTQQNVNPVHRYEVYQYLVASGKMDEGGGSTNDHKQWSSAEFKALPIPMMRWSVDARMNDDEILWLVDYALSEKEKGKNYFDAYNYIVYTMGHNFDNPEYYKEENREKYNEKYNFEEYFSDYGTENQQRMWMAFEEGTVCGGLTQTYSVLSDIFGRPSSPCGQPGHAASATYEWNRTNQRYEWVLQNDISGWVESGNQFDDRMLGWGDDWKDSWSKWTNASYTVLASDAVMNNNYSKYEKANLLILLADSYTDNRKQECYEEALKHQNINLDAWERLINCYIANENTTSSEYFALSKRIIEAYTYYPQAMVELLGIIESKVTDSNESAQLDVLKNNALVNGTKATPQESTCVNMTKQMANHYLNNNQSSELATFSFDGENAGKIVLNSKYEGSQIRVRYSLDGGQTWKQTDNHIIELTDEEIASITSENDIKVGLVGTDAIHTIDILAGKTVSGLYANDLENLLIGSEQNLANLEFSIDNGKTWYDYIGGLENGIRIEGNVRVKVRYKAYGTYLQSSEVQYTFNEDNNTDERNYVQLKNVKLESYSTQQSDGVNHAAKNFIDGDFNSAWHTRYNYRDPNKHYTVSFDKERYITSLEYTPTGQNGRIKSANVYTSLDGENWVKSGSVTGLANNGSVKAINLDEATKCKYLMLVPTETYGNSIDETNMYVSGKMLSFFEKVVEDEEPEVPEEEMPNVPETPEVPEQPETPQPPVEEEEEQEPDVPEEDEMPEVPEQPETPQPPTEEDAPEVETPEFTHDVLELVSGDGEENTPYEFIVKPVEIDKFQSLLEDLKEWNLNFLSVVREDNYTIYKLKLEKKSRNIEDTIYINLKVEDSQTDILTALNELRAELVPPTEDNDTIIPPETEKPEDNNDNEDGNFEPVLDGTANDNMMVTPEINEGNSIETEKPEEIVKPNDSENTNNENNTVVDDTSTDNVKTGEVSLGGHILLGASALLGLLKNRRKLLKYKNK